ncbi:MAG: TPM domain-containing protein [Cytophagaceae bacterium]
MAQTHFTTEQEQLIVQSIKEAEKKTSGEIRVHIENHCDVDLLDRAADVFALLGMHKTALRNGVLFYIAMEDHKFAILGDAGINSKVPSGYWNQIKEVMRQYFIQKDFTGGICKGIELAGEKLQEHFPYHSNDVNELADTISFHSNKK